MKVESDTTAVRANAVPPVSAAAACDDWASSPLVREILKCLPDGAPRFVARAPGRLDVMGGLGGYTGSLVANLPLAEHVVVGVQPCDSGELSIAFVGPAGRDGHPPVTMPLSLLFDAGKSPVAARAGRALLGDGHSDLIHCALGAIVEALRDGMIVGLNGGLRAAISSTLQDLSDVGAAAAAAAATLVALAGAYDVALDVTRVATICQTVQSDWLDAPMGTADAAGVLLGRKDSLLQVKCDPCTQIGMIDLPDNLALLGIDCGALCSEAALKFRRVRTASFMGCALIDRIIRYEGVDDLQWDGHLSRVSVTDYVERFRDRLPTKLRGSEFLERFGESGDPHTMIEAGFVYKIRSRTEHHIYEHARVFQFVQCLSRAIRNNDDRALTEAGELMYASHWSYGQRCGLGSVETDVLVTLLRKHGLESGIFGAKVGGGGCGGCVTVLMRSTERAMNAVEDAIQVYQTRLNKRATLMRGSSPGAAASGVRRL